MAKLFETYNKFNVKKSDTKVRVFCRICYANIWEPKSILGSEPKYSVSCLFDKDDKKTLDMIGEAVEAAKEAGKEKWGEKFLKAPKFKLPLHDGDTDRPDDAPYKGMMFVNATSTDAPEVVDRKKHPITDPMMVGSGDYVMITLNFAPYNADNTNKGIGAYLSNIQLAARGDRLSGKATADADFDELPGDDEEVLSEEIPDFI